MSTRVGTRPAHPARLPTQTKTSLACTFPALKEGNHPPTPIPVLGQQGREHHLSHMRPAPHEPNTRPPLPLHPLLQLYPQLPLPELIRHYLAEPQGQLHRPQPPATRVDNRQAELYQLLMGPQHTVSQETDPQEDGLHTQPGEPPALTTHQDPQPSNTVMAITMAPHQPTPPNHIPQPQAPPPRPTETAANPPNPTCQPTTGPRRKGRGTWRPSKASRAKALQIRLARMWSYGPGP